MMPNQITHPWSTEEINFLKDNLRKLTYKQIGEIINRSPASIQSKVRYLPFQKKIKKHPVNFNFFKAWSPEMAYVLGFIAADGNICHTGRAYVLHIACDDLDVIEKIKTALEYQGPIHNKPRFNRKVSYSIRICDPIIFQDLQKLGVTERKSLTFTPPKIPTHLIRHFVRGYFDGDGSVSLRNVTSPSRLVVDLYTASENMALRLDQTMRELLKDLYQGKVFVHLAHQKTQYYVVHLGHKASVKLFNYMYPGTHLYMERKYKKFLEGLSYAR